MAVLKPYNYNTMSKILSNFTLNLLKNPFLIKCFWIFILFIYLILHKNTYIIALCEYSFVKIFVQVNRKLQK